MISTIVRVSTGNVKLIVRFILSLKHNDRTYRLGLRCWDHGQALVVAALYVTWYVSDRFLLNNAISVVDEVVSAVGFV